MVLKLYANLYEKYTILGIFVKKLTAHVTTNEFPALDCKGMEICIILRYVKRSTRMFGTKRVYLLGKIYFNILHIVNYGICIQNC